ncbi:MAG: tryptophan synthase subunit alpha [Elusimicrobiota bacterium]|nr:tryptophan synthase subunit alpha [Endomicrobiia bacterium]MDW8166235.1 tryptophan synthase subunit alpha [Elusimicrobiota bacterium]
MQELFINKKQFIPFVTCGFPNKKKTVEVIKLFLEESVEIIEIGVPFSDPVADGPTIQYSSYVALKNKIGIEEVFETISTTMKYKPYCPVIMTYLNPVIVYGIENFFKDAYQVGVKGVIFADSIVENVDMYYSLTTKYGICNILLLSPTTKLERRKLIYRYTTGFIYLVTLTGTTGAREKLPDYFYSFVKQIRKETKQPLCVGFGISKLDQVLGILKYIDGVIVGSFIVDLIRKGNFEDLKNFIKKFTEIAKIKNL